MYIVWRSDTEYVINPSKNRLSYDNQQEKSQLRLLIWFFVYAFCILFSLLFLTESHPKNYTTVYSGKASGQWFSWWTNWRWDNPSASLQAYFEEVEDIICQVMVLKEMAKRVVSTIKLFVSMNIIDLRFVLLFTFWFANFMFELPLIFSFFSCDYDRLVTLRFLL